MKDISKIIGLHKSTFPKALFSTFIITSLTYLAGIWFIDIMGFKYWIVGFCLMPITFILKYFTDKFWVFRKNKVKR